MSDLRLEPVPLARTEDILTESLDDEVLVYDLRTHEATCLNASAALIWDLCDSQRTIGDIVDEVGNAEITDRHVADLLDQLRQKNLLEGDATPAAHRVEAPASRRSFLGYAAAASLVLPVVISTKVPAAAAVQPFGTSCDDIGGGPGASFCNGGEPFGLNCCSFSDPGGGNVKCCVGTVTPGAMPVSCPGGAPMPAPPNCLE